MKKHLSKESRITIQLIVGIILVVAGLVLIFSGLWLPPIGIIDPSVLVAYGEVSTFAGALIGVDYKYQYQTWRDRRIHRIQEDQEGQEYE